MNGLVLLTCPVQTTLNNITKSRRHLSSNLNKELILNTVTTSQVRPSSDWSGKSVLMVSALSKSLLSDGPVGREEVGPSPNLGSPWHSLELL